LKGHGLELGNVAGQVVAGATVAGALATLAKDQRAQR
jgi:hypothetical protein